MLDDCLTKAVSPWQNRTYLHYHTAPFSEYWTILTSAIINGLILFFRYSWHTIKKGKENQRKRE